MLWDGVRCETERVRGVGCGGDGYVHNHWQTVEAAQACTTNDGLHNQWLAGRAAQAYTTMGVALRHTTDGGPCWVCFHNIQHTVGAQ